MKVAIVGGGVAGLAVAEALLSSTARIDVTVYEQQPRAGGLVRTERRDGYLCEHGPSGFLDNTPQLKTLDPLQQTVQQHPQFPADHHS